MMASRITGIRYIVGPSPRGQCWGLVCEAGHVTRWTFGEKPGDAPACMICGRPARWQPSSCPSTHGTAGPYEPVCSICGAQVVREDIHS